MIYNTNRTTSLSDEITVDVNESYFGVGALDFMQENAIEEFALFEAAINSDIQELSIKESAELEALNEGFIQNAIGKLTKIWEQFIQWIEGVIKSWQTKFDNYLKTQVNKVVKQAAGRLDRIPEDFKYEGKAIKFPTNEGDNWTSFITVDEGLYEKAKEAWVSSKSEEVMKEIDEKVKAFNEKKPRKDLAECFENKEITKAVVMQHFDYLKKCASDFSKDKAEMKALKEKAKANLKNAKKEQKEGSTISNDNRGRYAAMIKAASAHKNCVQAVIRDIMFFRAEELKVAIAIVTKGLMKAEKPAKETALAVKEAVETTETIENVVESVETTEEVVEVEEAFDEEAVDALIEAVIESSNYEIEQLFEEMSTEDEVEVEESTEVEDEVEAEFKEEE